jgi:prevent-host-death family protein
MRNFNLSEVRKELPSLIDEVSSKKEGIVITRRGKPVARLMPYGKKEKKTDRYPLRGIPIRIADDFDEPMPELWETLHP